MDLILALPVELQDLVFIKMATYYRGYEILRVLAGIPDFMTRRHVHNRLYKLLTINPAKNTALWAKLCDIHNHYLYIYIMIQQSKEGLWQALEKAGISINDIITPSKIFNPFMYELPKYMLSHYGNIYNGLVIDTKCRCASKLCSPSYLDTGESSHDIYSNDIYSINIVGNEMSVRFKYGDTRYSYMYSSRNQSITLDMELLSMFVKCQLDGLLDDNKNLDMVKEKIRHFVFKNNNYQF